MNKGFWISVGLLILLAGGLRSLFKPATSINTDAAVVNMNSDANVNTNVDTNANAKLMISLDSFRGFHHDADILLKELTVLKADTESAIATKDIKLLGIAINNTYRVMDNVNINRIPTIAPFEVCDRALATLSRYAISTKTYYSNPDKTNIDDVNELKNTFNTKFTQCQSMVNDKSVEALYQDYQ
jgi:hypothetical protein